MKPTHKLIILFFCGLLAVAVCLKRFTPHESPSGQTAALPAARPSPVAEHPIAPRSIPAGTPAATIVPSHATRPAFADALLIADRIDRQHALQSAAANLAVSQPAALSSYLASLTDRADRNAFLRGAFSALSTGLPEEALGAAVQLAGQDRKTALDELTADWAGREKRLTPEAEAYMAATYGYETALGMRLLKTEPANPALAFLYSQQVLSGAAQHDLVYAAIKQIAAADPQAALQMAGSIGDAASRWDALSATAEGWARTDGAAALAWARSLPPGEERLQVEARAIERWFPNNPSGAAAQLVVLPQGKARSDAVTFIASSSANRDPAAALAWANQLPPADCALAKKVIAATPAIVKQSQSQQISPPKNVFDQ